MISDQHKVIDNTSVGLSNIRASLHLYFKKRHSHPQPGPSGPRLSTPCRAFPMGASFTFPPWGLPRLGHFAATIFFPLGQAYDPPAGSCGQVRPVAKVCKRLRNVKRTHLPPPEPQRETGNVATHLGKMRIHISISICTRILMNV